MTLKKMEKAIKNNDKRKVRALLLAGFDINLQTPSEKLTAPMLAVFYDKPHVLTRILLSRTHLINFGLRNVNDQSLLQYAIALNNYECFNIILKYILNDAYKNEEKYNEILNDARAYAKSLDSLVYLELINSSKRELILKYPLMEDIHPIISRKHSGSICSSPSSSPAIIGSGSLEIPLLELSSLPLVNHSSSASSRLFPPSPSMRNDILNSPRPSPTDKNFTNSTTSSSPNRRDDIIRKTGKNSDSAKKSSLADSLNSPLFISSNDKNDEKEKSASNSPDSDGKKYHCTLCTLS